MSAEEGSCTDNLAKHVPFAQLLLSNHGMRACLARRAESKRQLRNTSLHFWSHLGAKYEEPSLPPPILSHGDRPRGNVSSRQARSWDFCSGGAKVIFKTPTPPTEKKRGSLRATLRDMKKNYMFGSLNRLHCIVPITMTPILSQTSK